MNLELLKVALDFIKTHFEVKSISIVLIQVALVDFERISEPWASLDKRLLNFVNTFADGQVIGDAGIAMDIVALKEVATGHGWGRQLDISGVDPFNVGCC